MKPFPGIEAGCPGIAPDHLTKLSLFKREHGHVM